MTLLAAAPLTSGCGDRAPEEDATTKHDAAIEQPVAGGAERGREVYELFCATCHATGEGRAGTMRLAERLGSDKAVLVERTDLQPEYVKGVVRRGIMLMPPFRPSEIPDADLEALAEFLAAGGRG
jgi:cytochrome c5